MSNWYMRIKYLPGWFLNALLSLNYWDRFVKNAGYVRNYYKFVIG
jgi:hypothetical protein